MRYSDLPSGESRSACGPCSPPPWNAFELGDFIVLIVAIGIAGTIQPAAGTAVDREIQTAKRGQHPLGGGDFDVQVFHAGGFIAADGGRRDAEQALVALVAGDQSALVIGGQADPGSLLFFGHGVKQFDLKAGQDLKHIPRAAGQFGVRRLRKHIAPRLHAELAQQS